MRRPALPLAAALALALLAAPSPSAADTPVATAEQPSETWDYLRGDLFGERPVLDGSGMISLDTPYRAEDAAIVPVGISVDPGPGHRVTRLTLVIDENPSPVAAEFELGEGMGPVVEFAVRVRVNAYSNVRVIAELEDGSLHQFARFVKASGGCAAPALKDADAAMANLGEIRLREFAASLAAADPRDTRPEAQVMVRHPNNSGFQMDPMTRLYIPAYFVDTLEVFQGEDVLFRMTGGISISEDPTIRFRYMPSGAGALEVHAVDTDAGDFRKSFQIGSPS